MDLLLALLLRILHFLYALFSLIRSLWKRQTRPCPQPLRSRRHRIPKSLALVFATDSSIPQDTTEETVLQSILNVVEWCQVVGIPKLTIYEEHGLIHRLEPKIRGVVLGQHSEPPSSDSETEYRPLTPPSSVYSESRQLSPCRSNSDITGASIIHARTPKNGKKKQPSTELCSQPCTLLCLLAGNSSKDVMANTARYLFLSQKRKPGKKGQRTNNSLFTLNVDSLNTLLEDDSGLSPPDFMLVHPISSLQSHRTPLELHGFPPWYIHLTEIYHNQNQGQPRAWRDWLTSRLTYTPIPVTLDETSFRAALDAFSAAEMRFGK